MKGRPNWPETRDSDGDRTVHRELVVELSVSDSLDDVRAALREEATLPAPRESRWYGYSSTRVQHHPVRVSDADTLHVAWGATPSAASFLDDISRYVHQAEPAAVTLDFTQLRTVSRQTQDARLIELVDAGRKLEAVRAAREIHDQYEWLAQRSRALAVRAYASPPGRTPVCQVAPFFRCTSRLPPVP